MTQSEMIQQLYNEISRQNTIYMSIIGGLITIFAIFQWVVNEKRLKNVIDNKINKMVIDKYHLEEVMQKSFVADDFVNQEIKMKNDEASDLFNQTTSLISLAKKVADKSDSQTIILQLIINNITEMKIKSNNFSEYDHHLKLLVDITDKMDDSSRVMKIIKSIIKFISDPSKIEEMIKSKNAES